MNFYSLSIVNGGYSFQGEGGFDVDTNFASILATDFSNDSSIQLDPTSGVAIVATNAPVSISAFGGVFLNLPTSDPSVSGQLWNDGGTVKVSA